MDTAEKVDDQGAGSGLTGHGVFREEPVSQENACAGAGIGFNHIEDGLARFGDLFGAEGSEDAVVDGIVQEEDFSRFYEDTDEREDTGLEQDLDAGRQEGQDDAHDRADEVEAEDGHDHAQDADGEVVDEHFEARLDAAVDSGVKFLDDQAGQGPHDHGTHEHGVGRAADDADRGNGTHDGAAQAADDFAALEGDEQGQDVGQERSDHFCQLFVRQPAAGDE